MVSKFFPKTRFVLFSQKDMGGLKLALKTNNDKMIEANHEHQILPKYQQYLDSFVAKVSNPDNPADIEKPELDCFLHLLEWPLGFRIPVIDLTRLFLLHHSSSNLFTTYDNGATYTSKLLGLLSEKCVENLKLVTCRALCNLFHGNSSTRSIMSLLHTLYS